ncbi:uncharacterized protein LOC119368180 [Triticum dicoccoides]|uniref:uncharacterized protein LOC119368180 n=1 Tax=Triticum dicoccoides TaxID=85692 RepID=UPI00188F8B73|nr:uncharacterized protein LOC119368180 [Triticum dicoccoides]
MLPSSTSSDRSQGLTREASVKAKEWLVELVGRSVEAGKPRQGDSVQSTCSRGAPGHQISLVTLPRPAGNSRFRLVTNLALVKEAREWILYLTEERLEAWPEMPYFSEPGAFASRLSQTIPDAFTRPV